MILKENVNRTSEKKGLRYTVTSGNGFKSEKPNEIRAKPNENNNNYVEILDELGLQNPINTSDNSDDDYY